MGLRRTQNGSHVLLIALVIVVVGVVGFVGLKLSKKQSNDTARDTTNNAQPRSGGSNKQDIGDPTSTDPVTKGKSLAVGNCTGSGSKELTSLPMRTDQMSIVVPYGLLAGGHVTPIDHQYYWGKVQMGEPDMYDVLAPGDGKLVQIQYRSHNGQGKVKGDYRGVIAYSCTFFSYFDLATSLSADIQAKLPKDWESKGTTYSDIDVKAGQVIGKVGGQSLDFAVWDTTKTLKNLLVPMAYNNAEPWKINTVPPLNYYSQKVKDQVLPFYGRSLEPRDGIIDQDIDGKFIGNWFKEGSNGYAGGTSFTGGDYYKGHLAIVHDLYDPTGYEFSIGSSSKGAVQYAIKNPSVVPDKADKTSGLVKYELVPISYVDGNGQPWMPFAPTKTVKLNPSFGMTAGTALVQMLDTRKLKAELFLDKTPAEVKGFTGAAVTYDRGDGSKMSVSTTAGN